MLATKEASKEKEVKAEKEVKETKPAAKVEKKPESKKEDLGIRHLTEEENASLKEDLKDFTPREKAYFYQMRRDRKLRQEAEADRDAALFRESKLKSDKKEEKPKEVDPLEGKDPEDFLTVGEVRELLKKQNEKPAEDRTEKEDKALRVMQMNYLKLSEKEAKAGRDDFDAVMELAPDLISKDEKALREVAERTQNGENPAVVMYDLIKNHKEFETLYPAAEVKAKARKEAQDTAGKKVTPGAPSSVPASTPEQKAKEEKAKQAEKALEDNTNRTKTTAHVSSVESKPAGELTMEEIAKMSDLSFAKLPKNVREKYLKKFG